MKIWAVILFVTCLLVAVFFTDGSVLGGSAKSMKYHFFLSDTNIIIKKILGNHHGGGRSGERYSSVFNQTVSSIGVLANGSYVNLSTRQIISLG